MFKTLKNAWKTPELQKKMLFTLFIVLLYRLGACICVPYVSSDIASQFNSYYGSSVLGLMSILSGGAMQYATLFALSVSPYITASIVIQLLTIAIPPLERLAKDGANGQKKINAITRYVTVGLALITSFGYSMLLKNNGWLIKNATRVNASGVEESYTNWFAMVVINAAFCAGAALVMWLSEMINDKGIGNGISIILFVSIVARFPNSIIRQINNVANGDLAWWVLVLMYLGALLLIVLIVLVNDAERRLPVQYSKRVVGRKMYGGQSTHLPMKVNMSGVLPIIFAQSIASLPATICAFVPKWQNGWVMKHIFDTTTWPYIVIYFLLIIFFSYFYSTIQFNPIEVANNLKKNGGFIPGFRAGKPTSEFIQKVLNKITLFGAIYLSVIAITPLIVSACSKAEQLTGISLGGTSIIIVVGVALETVRALEAQMLMRNYKGFLN